MSGNKSKVQGGSKSLHYDQTIPTGSLTIPPQQNVTPFRQSQSPQLSQLSNQNRKSQHTNNIENSTENHGVVSNLKQGVNPIPVTGHPSLKDKSEFFKVFARVRPINAKEKSSTQPKKRLEVTRVSPEQIVLMEPDTGKSNEVSREKTFTFDGVFNEKDDNQRVYNSTIQHLLSESLLEGYNATVFAYGQTGAGKTYTLFGDEYKQGQFIEGRDTMTTGIIALTIKDLFALLQQPQELSPQQEQVRFSVKASYLEIYNETIRDLLVDQDRQTPLLIVEDPNKGVMVPDLSEFIIYGSQELNELIRKGNNLRVMASTQSNQYSSRSHGIIQIVIEKTTEGDSKNSASKMISRLSLIDLAGSERAAVSENRGIRLMEGSKINRSLLALGNCINILSDARKQGAYVPYRDSKLTRLLKDSLGGNTQTIMIACIAPTFLTYEESLNTLKYAQRAKQIKNVAKQNVVSIDVRDEYEYKQIINSLREEIQSLKSQMKSPLRNKQAMGLLRENLSLNFEASKINLKNHDMDDLSSKIFLNIEENWEITSTLRDLESLRQKNEATLRKLHEEESNDKSRIDFVQITAEIVALQQTMSNNSQVLIEMQENLNKNLQEKAELRNCVKTIIESSGGAEKTLEETCRILQLEKLDLYSQNFQIKQEAQSLALEKQRTETRLKQMEREMLEMKKKLSEKDAIISKSTLIIDQLKSSNNKDVVFIQHDSINPTLNNNHNNSKKKKKNLNRTSISNISPKHIKKTTAAANQSQQQEQMPLQSTLGSALQEFPSPVFNLKPIPSNHVLQQQLQQKEAYYRQPSTKPTSQTVNDQLLVKGSSRSTVGTKNNGLTQKAVAMIPSATEASPQLNRFSENHTDWKDHSDVKKEYFYFDSKNNLVKRDPPPASTTHEVSKSLARLKENNQEIVTEMVTNDKSHPHYHQQQQRSSIPIAPISQYQQTTSKKNSNTISIDLDSLKKFEEIQKQRRSIEERESSQQKRQVIDNQQLASKNYLQQQQKAFNARIEEQKMSQAKKKGRHVVSPFYKNYDTTTGNQAETIESLKSYANSIKNYDFKHVQIKPDLKKFKKFPTNQGTEETEPEDILTKQVGISHNTSQKQFEKSSPQVPNTVELKFPGSNESPIPLNWQQSSYMTHHQYIHSIQELKEQESERKPHNLQLQDTYQSPKQRSKETLDTNNNLQIKQFQQQQHQATNASHQQTPHSGKNTKSTPQQSSYERAITKGSSSSETSNKVHSNNYSQQYLSHKAQDNGFQHKTLPSSSYSSARNESVKTGSGEKNNQEIELQGKKESNEEGGDMTRISEISLLQRINDISADETIQDFVDRFQKTEGRRGEEIQQITQQQQQGLNSALPARINLKSLDEARLKIRSFKQTVMNLKEQTKISQISQKTIHEMQKLLNQQQKEKYQLTAQEQLVLVEFERIIHSTYKKLDEQQNHLIQMKSQQPPTNQRQYYSNHPLPYSNTYSMLSSGGQSSGLMSAIGTVAVTTTPQINPSSTSTGLVFELQNTLHPNLQGNSIPVGEDNSQFQNAYYSKNSNNIMSSKIHSQQQVIGNQSNSNQHHYHHHAQTTFHNQNNISVNKKNIEQGAFSKIVNNYGEAAKVINHNPHHFTSSSYSSHTKNKNPKNSNVLQHTTSTLDSIDSYRRISFNKKTEKFSQVSVANPALVSVKEEANIRTINNNSHISGTIDKNGSIYNKYLPPHLIGEQQLDKLAQYVPITTTIDSGSASKSTENLSNFCGIQTAPFVGNQALQPPLNQIIAFQQNSSGLFQNQNVNNNNNNNQINLSTSSAAKGKSQTSYMSINSKRKSFKEENDRFNIYNYPPNNSIGGTTFITATRQESIVPSNQVQQRNSSIPIVSEFEDSFQPQNNGVDTAETFLVSNNIQ